MKISQRVSDTISRVKFSKEHHFINNIPGVMFFFSAHRRIVLYICTKFYETNLKRVSELTSGHEIMTDGLGF